MSKKRGYNKWTNFRWDELSTVDNPAQETATMDIHKRNAEKNDYVEIASSVTDGHQHGIRVSINNGRLDLLVMYATSSADENSHDHQVIRQDDGNYTLTMNAGHSHTLSQTDIEAVIEEAIKNKSLTVSSGQTATTVRKSIPFQSRSLKVNEEDIPMTKEEKERLEALEAENKTLKTVQGFSEERKAFYDSLDDTAKAAFLEKSEKDQDADIAKAKEATDAKEPKSEKSDGDFDAQTEIEALKAKNAELELNAEVSEVLKDLTHYPGSDEEKRVLVKTVLANPNEKEREVLLKNLKAQSVDASKSTITVGSSDKAETIDAEDTDAKEAKVDELAKAKVEADPTLSITKARVIVRRENPELRS